MGLGIIAVIGLSVWQLLLVQTVSGNPVFRVDHKFNGKERSLSAFRAHDAIRHGRMLGNIDLPLGGNGNPSATGLYFTKIQLGNPTKDYYVQVDTGSDVLWVNCAGCEMCPEKSDLGVKLTHYDPKGSSTSKTVHCNAEACLAIYSGILSGCMPEMLCYYQVTYGDGSATSGYFIEDYMYYDEVSGNLQTSIGNGSVVFGCGGKQEGLLSSSNEALDGIMGFGPANSSVLSQLSAAKKVKKKFSHCLDGKAGGGIFAIGEIVEPKLNTTPLIPNQSHYNVVMKSVEVAGHVMQLAPGSQAAIIDSGTTLAYIPDKVYQLVIKAIASQQPKLKLFTEEDQFKCFKYSENLDNGFPSVKFHFTESLSFTVYAHEYLFEIHDGIWCIGWQNTGNQSNGGSHSILLGDLVLSNKLVLYDLENQVLGWTEYNCSSSIKVKDDVSKAPDSLGAHEISSASRSVLPRRSLPTLVPTLAVHRHHHPELSLAIHHHRYLPDPRRSPPALAPSSSLSVNRASSQRHPCRPPLLTIALPLTEPATPLPSAILL
ncbi:hypothetical protein V2J09_022632 [Rumex salicifolius]